MVRSKKNPKEWFFKEKEELPIEWVHGLMSYIEHGDTQIPINLPVDYDDNQFPLDNEEIEAKFMKIGIDGDFTNNQENIILNNSQNLILNIYPNIAPFKSIENLIITLNNDANIRLIIKKLEGSIIFNESKNSTDKEVVFNLKESNIGLEELIFEITTTDTNVQINNINFNFNIIGHEISSIFKNLIKLNNDGKIDTNLLDIKFISGAETTDGEELPVNPDTNFVILPANIFPDIILEDDGDLFVSWDHSDLLNQVNLLRAEVEALSAEVRNALMQYSVGDILCSTDSQNPQNRPGWGGTIWELYAQGRVLVGINTADGDFNSPGKMGGAKTHQLSQSEMPSHGHTGVTGSGGGGNTSSNSHTHTMRYSQDQAITNGSLGRVNINGSNSTPNMTSSATHAHTVPVHSHSVSINAFGGNGAHNNVQPYVAVYIWRRIA